ncbi:MAG: class I SAM-dependent methyltransferase, partial [Proteobacteria bacterium]|nr:class I SAM-dependent methyltransferase [Pseudomonadota bacterium]
MNVILSENTNAVPNLAAIKSKQNAAWSAGNYAKIGTTLQIVGENLAEAMDLAPDSEVLDVAAGNGNATLAFARRWCDVTSTDYVEALLANGRDRSNAEALEVTFKMADAEALPFPEGRFDAAVSTFGAMFAPNQ